MIDKINQLLQEVEALKAANAEELEALRIKFLSKKGAINDLMADFRNVAAEQKKEVGMRLNELKNKAQEKINALKEQFESQDTGCDDIDLTRSAYPSCGIMSGLYFRTLLLVFISSSRSFIKQPPL